MLFNPEFDQDDKVGEGPFAKQDNVLRRSMGCVVSIAEVGFPGPDEDMTARKAQEPIALATLSKVEGHCSLSIKTSLGGDAEAKGRSEGANNINKWVQVTNRLKKLRTSVAHIVGLMEVDIDICDLIVLEKG